MPERCKPKTEQFHSVTGVKFPQKGNEQTKIIFSPKGAKPVQVGEREGLGFFRFCLIFLTQFCFTTLDNISAEIYSFCMVWHCPVGRKKLQNT